MGSTFDGVAHKYDREFTHTTIGQLQRQAVWQYLNARWQLPRATPLSVLELNCGTGEDAIIWAKAGCRVLASDIAPEMVAVARQKVETQHLSDQITVVCAAAQQLNTAVTAAPFDLIFSNFGGLNCLSPNELSSLARTIRLHYCSDNSRLVAVVMSSACLWEFLYFGAKGKVGEAMRRRQRTAVSAHVGNGDYIATWYYSPRRFAQLFSPYFSVEAVRPIGWAVPPSYMESFFSRHPFALRGLSVAESWGRNLSILSPFADHFLIDLSASPYREQSANIK